MQELEKLFLKTLITGYVGGFLLALLIAGGFELLFYYCLPISGFLKTLIIVYITAWLVFSLNRKGRRNHE